jgi:alanyl-tRNA synthetase
LWRVEFVCGFRTLATARGDFATLTQAASLLSCGMPEVPRMLGKMIEERREEHTALKRAEERMAEMEAKALLAGRSAGDSTIFSAVLDEASAAYLALLAAKIVAEAKVTVLLGSSASGHVAFAQSKGLPGDMGAVLRATLKELGGKGGGGKDFAQGTLADSSHVASFLGRAKALAAAG